MILSLLLVIIEDINFDCENLSTWHLTQHELDCCSQKFLLRGRAKKFKRAIKFNLKYFKITKFYLLRYFSNQFSTKFQEILRER